MIDDIISKRLPGGSARFWQDYTGYPPQVRDLFDILQDLAVHPHDPADKVSRLMTYYYPFFKKHYDDHTKRRKDLDAFEQIAARYSSVETLLGDLALEPPTESVADVESPGKDDEYLVLSTIHSAKGLEWDSVFIIYALDGRFPTMRSVESPEDLEEERRLMYVACTRAKEHLFITYPINIYDRESGLILTKPSRFLEELDGSLVEPWVIQEE